MSEQSNSGRITSFGSISVDKVISGVGANADVALLRQTVDTTYPGVRPGNSLSDGLFGAAEFTGAEAQKFSNDRTCLIKVPKGMSKENVELRLQTLPKARLWKKLSLHIENVLSDEQKAAIGGVSTKTLEDYKESHAVRTTATEDKPSELVKFNGMIQYRAIGFSAEGREDEDTRNEEYAALKKDAEAMQIADGVPAAEKVNA